MRAAIKDLEHLSSLEHAYNTISANFVRVLQSVARQSESRMLEQSRLADYNQKRIFTLWTKGRQLVYTRRQRILLNKQSQLLVMACDIFV